MNRIKIQVILLILQSETDYFSSYSFQKCPIRSSGTTVFTETSRTAILHEEVLQDSSSSNSSSNSTSAHYTTIQRILHPESNSTCRRQRALRVLLLLHTEGKETFIPERNSTHRRQGDLLEIHPCVLQDIPGIQPQDLPKASSYYRHSSLSRHSRHSSLSSLSRHSRHSRDILDIPVIHDLPASPGNSTSSSISRDSNPFQHSPIRMHILHILRVLQFLQFDWFPQKTPPSTS